MRFIREEKGKGIEICFEKNVCGEERRGERGNVEEWMGDSRRGNGGMEDEEEDGRCRPGKGRERGSDEG